jgi:hypothetical protein
MCQNSCLFWHQIFLSISAESGPWPFVEDAKGNVHVVWELGNSWSTIRKQDCSTSQQLKPSPEGWMRGVGRFLGRYEIWVIQKLTGETWFGRENGGDLLSGWNIRSKGAVASLVGSWGLLSCLVLSFHLDSAEWARPKLGPVPGWSEPENSHHVLYQCCSQCWSWRGEVPFPCPCCSMTFRTWGWVCEYEHFLGNWQREGLRHLVVWPPLPSAHSGHL